MAMGGIYSSSRRSELGVSKPLYGARRYPATITSYGLLIRRSQVRILPGAPVNVLQNPDKGFAPGFAPGAIYRNRSGTHGVVHRVRQSVAHAGQHVGVGVERDGDGPCPRSSWTYLRCWPIFSSTVAQACRKSCTRTERGRPALMSSRLKERAARFFSVHRRARLSGECETVVLPESMYS